MKWMVSLGLGVIVLTVASWAVTRAHRGWTKTLVEVRTLDVVTGIEGITYERRFVPGLDFLVLGLLGGGLMLGISWEIRHRRSTKIKT